jgi:uncharacterized protein with PIN domain
MHFQDVFLASAITSCSRLAAVVFCPECKAEYRQGFTRCSDCDVQLVKSYVEAVRHPIAKKVEVPDEYGARLWHGTDPHFYLGLLGSLWNKKVACYGAPEYPPIPESMKGQPSANSEAAEFAVWVSKEHLPLAKWILDSDKEEHEKELLEEPEASAKVTQDDVSPETTGVCPLCFGEFTAAFSQCPNCNVSLNSPQVEVASEELAWELCDLGHPKFIMELRKALQAAGIPFNNANIAYGDVISAWSYRPNYRVLVLKRDFQRATQVMSQVLQHWEFEPSSGFIYVRDPFLPYGLEVAAKKGWDPEDISALVWSGENIGLVGGIGLALQEHQIPYRIEAQPVGTAKIFTHPEDEAQARELVQEVLEGPKPE